MQYDIINNNYNKFGGKYDMKELTTKDITEYLKNAMELESSIYKQERAIIAAKNSIEHKRVEKSNEEFYRKKYKERHIPKKKEIVKPENPKDARQYSPLDAKKGAIRLCIFLIVMGIIIFLEGRYFKNEGIGIGTPLIVLGVITSVIALYKMIVFKSQIKNLEIQETRLDAEYKQNIEEYEKQLAINEQEYKKEFELYEQAEKQAEAEYEEAKKALKQADEQIEKTLGAPLAQTRELLEKFYALNVIFPKYRNMVAICTIYEYFAAGRCTTLVGADGAYNLYESELRQNLIIGKLDKIISQLEEIKQNQYILYTELKKTNSITSSIYQDTENILNSVEKIGDTVQNIAHSSYITSYCAQVTAQNTQALKYIALING